MRADVSQFYPTLYTHALPWALHTKATAKEKPRDCTLLGKRLDRGLRRGQDNQTIGIPIGPSWSFALSELIMSRVDAALQAEFPDLQGMRIIDDYEFGVGSEADADRILATLRSELAHYELQLNATETAISRIPVPMMPTWKAQLRGFQIRPSAQADDLIRYFDLAASLGDALHIAAPVRWAASSLRWLEIQGGNWPLVHDLLLQAVLVEPGCIRRAMGSLLEHTRKGLPLNKDAVRDTLSRVIVRHVPLGGSSEVAWALWGAIAFEVRLDDSVGRTLGAMSDSVVAVLALDAERRGLLAGLDKTKWLGLITKEELRSDQWLLAYEAPRKGWLGTKPGSTGDRC